MNLYLIKASDTDDVGWDEYIGAVVAAEDESAARRTHPSGSRWWDDPASRWRYEDGREAYSDGWPDPDRVLVTLIGVATPGTSPGVLLDSYKAG